MNCVKPGKPPKVTEAGTNDEKERLFIKFPQNATIHAVLRDFTGSQWSHSKKSWHFDVNRTLAGLLYKRLKTFGPIDTRNLKEWFDSKQTLKDLDANLLMSWRYGF